jgi:hypothetical protein
MNSHSTNPHNYSVQSPHNKKIANIGSAGFINVIFIEKQDYTKCDPESSVGTEGTVAEIVTNLEFLQPGHELGESTKNDTARDNRA